MKLFLWFFGVGASSSSSRWSNSIISELHVLWEEKMRDGESCVCVCVCDIMSNYFFFIFVLF